MVRSCTRPPVRQIDGRFHAIGQAQLHQFDVVADELNFLFERNVVLVVLVKHIAQHVAEAMHGELGFRPVDGNQRIDIVQRVEQEMGIQLALQVLQLGLRSLLLDLLLLGFDAIPVARHPDSDGQPDRQGHQHGVPCDEKVDGAADRPGSRAAVRSRYRGGTSRARYAV